MALFRSILFFVWLLTLSTVMWIVCIPSFFLPRLTVVWLANLWARLVLWGLTWTVGQRVEIRGRLDIPKGGALIAAKHYSMWETVALTALLPDPAIIFKRELLWIPFYGWYGIKQQMIPIDRDAGAKTLLHMRRASERALKQNRPILIFPEGTRRKIGAPPEYKSGIAGLYAMLKVPCIPVALNSGLYWHGIIGRPGTIVIEFLDPIAPGTPRREFMKTLETRIETATNRLVAEGQAKIES